MNTQHSTAHGRTDRFKPESLPDFHSSTHPLFHSSILPLLRSQITGHRLPITLFTFISLSLAASAHAGDGTWTNFAGGSWATAGNWSNSVIADGSGSTADFGTLNIAADRTVTLDGARTIGYLKFGDTTPSHNWILSAGTGDPLTLDVASGSPVITVSNQTAVIPLVLAGTHGLRKSGAGALLFDSSDVAHTFTGGVTVDGGVLAVWLSRSSGSGGVDNRIPTGNSLTLNGAGFQASIHNVSHKQTFSGLVVSNACVCGATAYAGGGAQCDLAVGGIRRSPGAIVLFNRYRGAEGGATMGYILTTNGNDAATGILGPWAFHCYSWDNVPFPALDITYRYAVNSGAIRSGMGGTQIDGLAGTTVTDANSFSSATANYNFSAGVTLASSRTAHTARYYGTNSATTTIASGTTLTLNGLLNAGTYVWLAGPGSSPQKRIDSGALIIDRTGSGALVIGDTAELVVCPAANGITIAAPITNGVSAGGLTKAGPSNLTLSAVNTYTGDTWVHEGVLAVATNAGLTFKIAGNGTNNCVRGNGTLLLDGDFYFELTGAGGGAGAWMIVDSSILSRTTFSGTFKVNGFANAGGGKWRQEMFTFDTTTGILTARPPQGLVVGIR